ncbi:MAG: glycogen/starch/alpha-glucan phosphorylase [Alphaproteobacteria bacterium]|nr:glycogen/starch/alpha-glucan phosphorylase [Alphaproteobacteria bacterium]MBQ9235649.1 glycogen/starch/alpha-glucan phosphorylase [Alphaproteobacteria bacterium]
MNEIDKARLKFSIEHYIEYFIGKRVCEITKDEALQAIALAVREFAMDKMYQTIARYNKCNSKRVYYLSIEYLLGRSLENNLHSLGLFDIIKSIKIDGFPDISLEEIFDTEYDPALGNGGLGRLAACYLDSMASLGIAGFGYGINYKFGLFKQKFENGYQVEQADTWLGEESPWQFARHDRVVKIPIYGNVEILNNPDGTQDFMWMNTKTIYGVPFDFPIVGYGGRSVNYLRLFSAKTDDELDINVFNKGGYIEAMKDKIETETISKVLYPADDVESGKELRLKQQYFFVSCAIQDIIRRFLEKSNDFKKLPTKVVIQLNDTHPAIAIAEMMRLLVDVHGLEWDDAWDITSQCFAYTNHTLLPEALETWPASLIGRMLPRHLQIIYEINRRFMEFARLRFGNDEAKLSKVSIVSGEGDRQIIRMANLSIVGSFSVNGVAAIHSELIKTKLVPEFYELWPEKFLNITNGITPRRWLLHANTALAGLISGKIGDDWVTKLDDLSRLEPLVNDKRFIRQLGEVKLSNKQRLTKVIHKACGVMVNPDSMFIVHAKRIHEYKRQLMTILQVIGDYLSIIKDNHRPKVAKTYIFAGKAAPSYNFAKLIIKLINNVADVINNDPNVGDMLKVVFIPDYKVSLAEVLIPAADLSLQVSTAGFEASGTSNMKFALNGALTLGTLDGANIEIREAVGEDNFYLFGLTEAEVQARRETYNPRAIYETNNYIKRILNAVNSNMFCEKDYMLLFKPIVEELLNRDYYFILADLVAFAQTFERIEADFQDKSKWHTMTLNNIARIGKFSSDRSVLEYASDIWHIKSC